MKRILLCAVALSLWAAPAFGQALEVRVSQGSGWVLLDVDDLNARLRQAGYPAVSETALLYGTTSLFPQPDAGWRWGVAGLFWSARGGETVTLNSNLVGGVFDCLWAAPDSQYELTVVEQTFFVRAWGGMVITPWLSPWAQVATFFSGLGFDGPPANLGGPFGMIELSFGF